MFEARAEGTFAQLPYLHIPICECTPHNHIQNEQQKHVTMSQQGCPAENLLQIRGSPVICRAVKPTIIRQQY
jgi:hypothetical protein